MNPPSFYNWPNRTIVGPKDVIVTHEQVNACVSLQSTQNCL